MDHTFLENAFGVSRQYRHVRTEYLWGGIQLYLDLKEQALICPTCGSATEVIRKGRRVRCLQTVPIGLKPVYLITEVARCQCRRCERIFEVHPPLPGPTCTTPASSKRSWIN